MIAMRGLLLVLVFALAGAGRAEADWPMQRQNVSRTAEAASVSDLMTPTVQWRRYMGGAVDPKGLLATDVDGDGTVDVLYISGGRLVVKRANDRVVWESRPLTLRFIHGVLDLDGDGVLDVVASGTPGRVAIFRGSDGRLQWLTAPGRFGPVIGAVRFADLDGDGHVNMYATDAGCGSGGSLGDVGFAFDFADGFGTGTDDGSEVLWQLERGRAYNCGVNDVVLDVDGDGDLEIIAWATTTMFLFDAATGLKIPSGDDARRDGYPTGFSIPYGTAPTWVVDIEGDGRGDDVVLLTNGSYTPDVNSRAVFVVGWDASRPQAERLHTRWVQQVPDLVGDFHERLPEAAADLDGDGVVEVTTTFTVDGVSTVRVFDGRDGSTRLQIPGVAVAMVEVDGGTPILVVDDGAQLEGYRFTALDDVPEPAFTLPRATVLDGVRTSLTHRQSIGGVPLAVPLADGSRGMLVDENGTLKLWDVSGASPTLVGAYPLPAEVEVVATAEQTGVAAPGPGVLLARSDGYLVVLDDALRPINFGGSAEFALPGIRTGGFYSGLDGAGPVPVAADVGGGRADVFAVDSRGGLLRLSMEAASITLPPDTVFRRSSTEFPLLFDIDGDGRLEVVALDERGMVALEVDGRELWTRTLTSANEDLHGDVIPLATPSGLRLVTGIINRGDGNGSLAAVDTAGDLVWESVPTRVAGSGFGLPTIDELTGDATPDLMVNMASALRPIDGGDGTLYGSIRGGHSQMTIDVRGRAGMTTTIFAGSVAPPGGMNVPVPLATRTDTWTLSAGYDARNNYGAVVECEDGLHYATSHDQSAQITILRAEGGEGRRDAWLSEGDLWRTEPEANAVGRIPGLVGNATATADLGGGRAAVLFGSTDGHLYAVDPCGADPELLWSLSFRAPVGEAIFADTDGDGQDEMVVSVADGFLYGVDTEAIPAPAFVHDTDPGSGVLDEDVDETRGGALGARWEAVTGATGYEYAVFTLGDTPVTRNPDDASNPFIATTDTSMQHTERLESGTSYYVAVRAIGSEGTSAEALSDGTLFVFTPPDPGMDPGPVPPDLGPDTGPRGDMGAPVPPGECDEGCCCRVASTPVGPPWPLLGFFALLAWRRWS